MIDKCVAAKSLEIWVWDYVHQPMVQYYRDTLQEEFKKWIAVNFEYSDNIHSMAVHIPELVNPYLDNQVLTLVHINPESKFNDDPVERTGKVELDDTTKGIEEAFHARVDFYRVLRKLSVMLKTASAESSFILCSQNLHELTRVATYTTGSKEMVNLTRLTDEFEQIVKELLLKSEMLQ